MEIKPTEKDKLEFFNYIQKWQDKLGLQRWSVMLSNIPSKHLAEIDIDKNKEHKLCSVKIGNNWKSLPINSYNLEMVACHEMLHLFLHEFKEFIQENPFKFEEIMAKEHEIVNTLERLLIGPPKYE